MNRVEAEKLLKTKLCSDCGYFLGGANSEYVCSKCYITEIIKALKEPQGSEG